jgi:hypothetical protein
MAPITNATAEIEIVIRTGTPIAREAPPVSASITVISPSRFEMMSHVAASN